MTEEEFYIDYFNGRKDFRNTDLKGVDFFTPIIRKTHPEFFSEKISRLVCEDNPVVHKPMQGVNFSECDIARTSFFDTELLRVKLFSTSLSGIDGRFLHFTGADLSEVDFTGADLRFAIFTGTTISSTKFNRTKLDHAVFQFSHIENTIFSYSSAVAVRIYQTKVVNSHVVDCDFSNANLVQIKIDNCTLKQSKFSNAVLSSVLIYDSRSLGCKFSGSNMDNVRLKKYISEKSEYSLSRIYKTKIYQSNFLSDSFKDCVLSNSRLVESRYSNVDFTGTSLQNVIFEKSKFIRPIFGGTSFNNIDLSPFLNSGARHVGASSIDQNSVAITIMEEGAHSLDINPHIDLQKFLESCGMAPVVTMYLIDSIRALNKDQLREIMSSTFISYGGPDEEFSTKLNLDLTKCGINTFFFPLDAPFGEKLHSTMHRINDYDRTILICSKESLDRPGLIYELEKTIEREVRDGGISYIIPIALDDYVFNGWKPAREHLRTEILNRVVADFSDPGSYDSQFQRLLQSLKKLTNKNS